MVIATVPDLFFASKIGETAKQVGVSVTVVASPRGALDAVNPTLYIVDLNAAGMDTLQLVKDLKANSESVPIVAFVRHEMTSLIEEARAAGCDQVLTRNAFSRDLPRILRLEEI